MLKQMTETFLPQRLRDTEAGDVSEWEGLKSVTPLSLCVSVAKTASHL